MLIKRWELRGRAWSEKVKSQQVYFSASWSSSCCLFSCISNLIYCLTINPRAMGWNLQNHEPKELTPSLSSLVEIVVVRMRNVPQRLVYLNTWSPVCGAFWRGCRKLGGGVFLEEVHCCSQALLSVSSLNLVPVHLFGLVFEVEDVIFQLCPPPLSQDLLLATVPLPPQLILTPLQLQSRTNPFFHGLFWPCYFITPTEK